METDSPHLNAVGDIYLSPYNDGDEPLVDDVFVRAARSSRFVLDREGGHQYRFYLQDGTGSCVLKAFLDGSQTAFADKPFDTAVATRGLIFRFDVPGAGS